MGDMLKPGVGVVLCANGEMKRLEKEARFWSLKEMQKAVGGLIEFSRLDDGVHTLVSNEESLCVAEPIQNLSATIMLGRPLFGDVLVVREDDPRG